MIQGTNNNNQLVSFNDDDDSDLNDSYDEDGFSCEQSATKDPVHVGEKTILCQKLLSQGSYEQNICYRRKKKQSICI